MTRTKTKNPGNKGRRGRKRNRDDLSAYADRAEYRQAHLSYSTPEESPPPKKNPRLSSDQEIAVEAVKAFVENEHEKLRTQLKRVRKKLHREKAEGRRKQSMRNNERRSFPNQLPEKDESEKGANASNSVKEARTLERRSWRARCEMLRANSDDMIRTIPHHFLWSEYVKWAKETDTDINDQQQWTADQVTVFVEDGEESFVPGVKTVIGTDYQKQSTFLKSKKAIPGVAVIALASSAIRAVRIAPRLYDGQPVGKLFGKQKAEAQQQWLRRASRKAVTPTVVGTAKRVHRLIEDGHLTLEHTALVIIDFCRDASLKNVFDFPSERNEVFQFLHDFGCARVKNGMKIMLTIPKTQPVRFKDVKDVKDGQHKKGAVYQR